MAWLAKVQNPDGSWSENNKSQYVDGLTGLALLALLGDGHTTKRGRYKDAVAKGCEFLLEQQDPKKGLIGTSATMTFIYNHAIAANALVFIAAWLLSRGAPLAAPASVEAPDSPDSPSLENRGGFLERRLV